MSPNNGSNGGSSHDRRLRQRQDKDLATPQSELVGAEGKEQKTGFVSPKQKKKEAESKQRLSELLNLASFALGCGSWGWTVIAPESSAIFGSVLLFVAVIFALLGLQRIWTVGKIWFGLAAMILIAGFGVFDWFIVVKPQRGKPFQALLVEGYHISNECQAIPGATLMPDWMRDQSKEWQARVQQLVADKLSPNDAQLWQGAIVVGLVKDENLNAYQCLWLANKVGALETIIAAEYDPKLKHRDYNGPTYWFDAANGKVDISDAFKNGNRQASIFVNGGNSSSAQPK